MKKTHLLLIKCLLIISLLLKTELEQSSVVISKYESQGKMLKAQQFNGLTETDQH